MDGKKFSFCIEVVYNYNAAQTTQTFKLLNLMIHLFTIKNVFFNNTLTNLSMKNCLSIFLKYIHACKEKKKRRKCMNVSVHHQIQKVQKNVRQADTQKNMQEK